MVPISLRSSRGKVALVLLFVGAGQVRAEAVPDLDIVVAKRGDAVLTLGEVDAKVRTMPPELRTGYLTDPDRIARLVDSMLLAEQVANVARTQGEDENREYRADIDLLGNELLSGRHVRDYVAKLKTPNFENLARERYLADPKKFTPAPNLHYRHVLVSTDGRDDATSRAAADKIVARVQAGENFESVIEEVKKADSEGIGSGVLSNVDQSRLDPVFAVALHSLKKEGALSSPVRSRSGYHVIQLERIETFPTPSYEEVKDKVVAEMKERYLGEEKDRYFRRYSQLEVDLKYDVINTLPGRYGAQLAEVQAANASAAGVPVDDAGPKEE
jgi:peptidyl-prolyl cis-trans isomerase C